MDFRSLKYVTDACGGEQLGGLPETLVNRVCTDSRRAQTGDLFFALAGERFDGHDYAADVARKGVAALVVNQSRIPSGLQNAALIAVDDTRAALGRLAARYRTDFNLPVVAVGGSNGKTTTKELVAAVLRQELATLWSEASFNNDIGVPLTMLKLDSTHQAAVLEVGTNHPGELAPLVRMARPRYGVTTNIGREHLEFFGDLAGVAGEEGRLAELLPADGKFFVNGDGEWTDTLARRSNAPAVMVGYGPRNHWHAHDVKLDPQGVSFRVRAPKTAYDGEYRIGLLGRHQVTNALFALAVGAELGLSPASARRGLAECAPAKMRLESWTWNGVLVLDDSYNANADSMLAALRTLREMPCAGRRAAALGDMAELGAQSDAAHEEVGRGAAESGVEQLFAIGKMAATMARAARDGGLQGVSEFADAPGAVEAVKSFLKPGDVLLLKASRSTGLERLSGALRPQSGKSE